MCAGWPAFWLVSGFGTFYWGLVDAYEPGISYAALNSELAINVIGLMPLDEQMAVWLGKVLNAGAEVVLKAAPEVLLGPCSAGAPSRNWA